jgi:hypothetical protein
VTRAQAYGRRDRLTGCNGRALMSANRVDPDVAAELCIVGR